MTDLRHPTEWEHIVIVLRRTRRGFVEEAQRSVPDQSGSPADSSLPSREARSCIANWSIIAGKSRRTP
jgi:hypothetical protein